ncbi:DUF58 domain-containing protein [Rhodoferax sp.]|uniref:DUF58 domain-containing protein n=1 Tax=Rhodoferax sp. TaxID=50421 RepID=UPI0025F43236|nr:DUF58 domain-containing protein [Rhodoferax sp.]
MKTSASPSVFHHLMRAARAALAQWWQARLPQTDRLTLTQRNVYILPTGAGWMLAVTLLVLLIASINYQLNLGYLLTFLLGGSALVAMHVSHANLRGITLTLIAPEPVFMGAKAIIDVSLHNPRRQPRPAIALCVHAAQQWVFTDVTATGTAHVQLGWHASSRGLHPLPMLSAQTLFPLGSFRVWALWRPAAQLLVYPTPEAKPPPLPMLPANAAGAQAQQAVSRPGEPDGVRAYRRGDPFKYLLWKKVAKTGELISRDQVQLQQRAVWLERSQTGLGHPEQQLSRLCAWVLQADRQGWRFGLKLGAQEIAPDCGAPHLQRCLRALALA